MLECGASYVHRISESCWEVELVMYTGLVSPPGMRSYSYVDRISEFCWNVELVMQTGLVTDKIIY